MTLPVLDLPDDPQQLGRWLEGHLVGLELGDVVAELAAVHQDAGGDAASLDEVLGSQRDAVLHDGLSALEAVQIRRLLQHPRVLLELQELVFSSGGSHWTQLVGAAETDEATIDTVWSRLQSSLDAPAPPTVETREQAGVAWYSRPWVVSLATAAVVLLVVQLADQGVEPLGGPPATAQANVGWGWDKPGALPQDVPADEYLNTLADAAGAWFNKRPETAPDLARRISEFRQGCTTLLLAEHEPLSNEDRAWLRERCSAWAEVLDDHLAAVESGEEVLTVRAAADETINKLIAALRDRATTA